MTLVVESQGLHAYARQLDRAREDVAAIRGYLGRYAEAGTGGEVYNLARSGHEHAVHVVDGTLNRLSCLLEASAPEMYQAAAYYRSTDLAAAEKVDRSLPATAPRASTPVESEFAATNCPPPPFADARHVAGHLVAPGEVDKPSNPLGFMDYVSPSSWANTAFETVLGFEPIGWLQERVFGDWESLAAMRPVLANVGDALHALAYNVQTGASALQSVWEGSAADSAYGYFTDLANAVSSLQEPLDAIGHAYGGMADAVWAIGEALGGTIKALLDTAIVAGIAIAAGTATASTGVGAVVGYGVAAVEIANMLRLWANATNLYQKLSAAVNVFRAGLGRHLSRLEVVALPALPGGSGYDHPLVKR